MLKKGIFILMVSILSSCELTEIFGSAIDNLQEEFGSDPMKEELVLTNRNMESGTSEINSNSEYIIIRERSNRSEIVDKNNSPNKGSEFTPIMSYNGKDKPTVSPVVDEKRDVISNPSKSYNPSKSSVDSSNMSNEIEGSEDVRSFLLKGFYKRAADAQVRKEDHKNIYYKAIGSFNMAKVSKTSQESENYKKLADQRFKSIANDKNMGNLRIRGVLWHGITGYSFFLKKRSTEELVRPFNYILNNYPSTRYVNDAQFYKMLIYMKKGEKKKAQEMLISLEKSDFGDLIYDADRGKWSKVRPVIKYYVAMLNGVGLSSFKNNKNYTRRVKPKVTNNKIAIDRGQKAEIEELKAQIKALQLQIEEPKIIEDVVIAKENIKIDTGELSKEESLAYFDNSESKLQEENLVSNTLDNEQAGLTEVQKEGRLTEVMTNKKPLLEENPQEKVQVSENKKVPKKKERSNIELIELSEEEVMDMILKDEDGLFSSDQSKPKIKTDQLNMDENSVTKGTESAIRSLEQSLAQNH